MKHTHTLQFSKLHGLGNDFIVIDAIHQELPQRPITEIAQALCDRNFGIGADGLVLVEKSSHSDLKMRIINSDGSEPQMCGNGIRCLAKFAYENQLVNKEIFSVETLAGVIVPAVILNQGIVTAVEVDMGPPYLTNAEIPVVGPPGQPTINTPITVGNQVFNMTTVSMGNPHAVVFMDRPQDIEIDIIGPQFEHHPNFPERTNTEFVRIDSRSQATMRVWERGAGETLACGTGACAVLVAGVLNGLLDRKATIQLPGGPLSIEWLTTTQHVMMTGPATLVFEGQIQF
ncbi:diaminopimelate epimerase [bacterium]|nr:diaminopimelate epimerase [bacterium]